MSFRLVDARMKLDQARLLTHHAARLADAGQPFATEAAMAKLAASRGGLVQRLGVLPDAGRLRLLAGVPGGALAARRQARGDLGGDERHHAAHHLARDVPPWLAPWAPASAGTSSSTPSPPAARRRCSACRASTRWRSGRACAAGGARPAPTSGTARSSRRASRPTATRAPPAAPRRC